MKNKLKKIILLCLSLVIMVPSTAYATDDTSDVIVSTLTQEEVERIVAPYEKSNSLTRAVGLIDTYALGIEKSGSDLLIAAKTVCDGSVVKCGYTEIRIQQRKNSSYSWSNYVVFEDLYRNTFSYYFGASIRPQRGYQYRATCIHYAKKSIFSTEKISNVSNIVTM